MVEITDIEQWDADALEDIRSQYQRGLHVLTTAGDDFSKLRLSAADWTGETAEKAMGKHGQLVQHGDTQAAGPGAVVKALGQAADAVRPLPGQIKDARELARKYGFQVEESGELTDLFEGKDLPKDLHPDDRARAKKEIIAALQQIVRTADEIDDELAGVFNKADSGGYSGGPVAPLSMAAAVGKEAANITPPDPPKHGTPAQNAAWWHTLSGDEKDTLVEHAPGKIGNLDGVPATYRSRANMQNLSTVEAGLQKRIDKLKGELHTTDGQTDNRKTAASQADNQGIDEKLWKLEAKLRSLKSIGKKVRDSEGKPSSSKYYLLGVNSSGNGKAILAKGNPDTAKNVATYVPGMGSNLAGFDGEHEKSEAMWNSAGGSKTNTSVITWQGYDAPQNLGQATHGGYADDGKADFNHFQQGLRETHEGAPSHNVAVGHSYGTALIGHSARDGDPATDDIVFAGSPGVGADHASQLHVPSGHVYATEAKNDAIRAANEQIVLTRGQPPQDPILGPDPSGKEFGAHTFSSAPGGSDAHSAYWDRNNPSLYAMGSIIKGH